MTQKTLGLKPQPVVLTAQQKEFLVDTIRAAAQAAVAHAQKEHRVAVTARMALRDVTNGEGPHYEMWATQVDDWAIAGDAAFHLITDIIIGIQHGRLGDVLAIMNETVLNGRLQTKPAEE